MSRTGGGIPGWAVAGILASAAAALAFGYFMQVDLPFVPERLEAHRAILAGEAPAPLRYRVLVPVLVDPLVGALGALLPLEWAFLVAYGLYDVLALLGGLAALYALCRRWFTVDQALVGTLFAAVTTSVALREHFFQPWSLLEPAFLGAAVLLALEGRRALMVPLVAVAALNRETAGFLPLAYLAVRLPWPIRWDRQTRSAAAWTLGYLAVVAAVVLGLRALLGTAPFVDTFAQRWAENTRPSNLVRTVVHIGLFLGIFWVLAALGWRRAPAPLRRVSLLALPWLAGVAWWGIWHEVRLLLGLLPLVVPLALAALYRPAPGPHGEDRARIAQATTPTPTAKGTTDQRPDSPSSHP